MPPCLKNSATIDNLAFRQRTTDILFFHGRSLLCGDSGWGDCIFI